jgi:hypothetical protein
MTAALMTATLMTNTLITATLMTASHWWPVLPSHPILSSHPALPALLCCFHTSLILPCLLHPVLSSNTVVLKHCLGLLFSHCFHPLVSHCRLRAQPCFSYTLSCPRTLFLYHSLVLSHIVLPFHTFACSHTCLVLVSCVVLILCLATINSLPSLTLSCFSKHVALFYLIHFLAFPNCRVPTLSCFPKLCCPLYPPCRLTLCWPRTLSCPLTHVFYCTYCPVFVYVMARSQRLAFPLTVLSCSHVSPYTAVFSVQFVLLTYTLSFPLTMSSSQSQACPLPQSWSFTLYFSLRLLFAATESCTFTVVCSQTHFCAHIHCISLNLWCPQTHRLSPCFAIALFYSHSTHWYQVVAPTRLTFQHSLALTICHALAHFFSNFGPTHRLSHSLPCSHQLHCYRRLSFDCT